MERIRTGDIAVDLYRPADLQMWWLAADLGRAAVPAAGPRDRARSCSARWSSTWRCPASPLTWLAFLVSVALGVVVSFAVRYPGGAVRVLADGRGGADADGVARGLFFSGMLLPLNVFPGALGDVARALPWAAMLQVPADVFLGRAPGGRGAGGVRLPGGVGGGAARGRAGCCSRSRRGGWWCRVAEPGVAEPGRLSPGWRPAPSRGTGVRAYGLIVGDVGALHDGVPGVVRDDRVRELRGDRARLRGDPADVLAHRYACRRACRPRCRPARAAPCPRRWAPCRLLPSPGLARCRPSGAGGGGSPAACARWGRPRGRRCRRRHRCRRRDRRAA